MSRLTVSTELEAMQLLFYTHLNHFARIKRHSFQDGVLPKVKLWDLPPVNGAEHAFNGATFQENPDFFAEHGPR